MHSTAAPDDAEAPATGGLLPTEAARRVRRDERRRRAMRVLEGKEIAWPQLAFGAPTWLAAVVLLLYGDRFAAFLGVTIEALGWTCLSLAAVVLLTGRVVMLERKVKALTQLLDAD